MNKPDWMKEAAGEIADKQETHMLNEAAVLHILRSHAIVQSYERSDIVPRLLEALRALKQSADHLATCGPCDEQPAINQVLEDCEIADMVLLKAEIDHTTRCYTQVGIHPDPGA